MSEYVVAVIIDNTDRHYQEKIRLKGLRDRSNPFTITEEKFLKIYRIPKAGAEYLLQVLDGPRLEEGHIPKNIKILCALHFYAQGSYQSCVGQDNFLALSQSSVSRCLAVIGDLVVEKLAPSIIKFPTTDLQVQEAKREFQELFNFPNTLGAVDGTHVGIIKPPLSHPTAPGSLFYNRKGYYSINCLIVCSAKGNIIGVNPNFPGSTHDAAVWMSSKINSYLKDKYVSGQVEQWLIGDKGYPLQPWLMTPVMHPESNAEVAYNANHARARNVVELCNGRLKNKFRCLHHHRCLHYQPEKAAKIFVTCCTFYNMFKDTFNDDEDEYNINSVNIDEVNMDDYDQDFLLNARRIREQTIHRYFD